MARTGMANPILKLRELTNVGTADYTLGVTTFWGDDNLQSVLDRYRTDLWRVGLTAQRTIGAGGTAYYYDYYFAPGDYEEGTAQFIIRNGGGTALGTANYSSINYAAGVVNFGTVDQLGSAYYLDARAYDLNAAAAHVWRSKAANVSAYYDFSADGHSMSRSQMVKQFQEMAELFSSQAKPVSVKLRRGDDPAG